MEVKKTNESVNRQFDAAGNSEDNITSVRYEINDDDGQRIGEATVYPTHMIINIPDVYGFNSIDEGVDRLKSFFGVSE